MPRVSEEYFENKRKEILDAAYRVCVTKPVNSVVMKDIIDETGFSHGVIYKYYKDLDEVLTDLVIRINSENRIDDGINEILNEEGTKNWETAIRRICDYLADSMKRVGRDMMKLSLYCDHLAMSDPERVNRIAVNLGKDGQSPLVYLVAAMDSYLRNVIKKEKLHPVKSVDEILQFMIVSFQGIQSGYVLSAYFPEDQVKGKYLPEEMFSCLAESMILMIKG